jgi:hypothetical protein
MMIPQNYFDVPTLSLYPLPANVLRRRSRGALPKTKNQNRNDAAC